MTLNLNSARKLIFQLRLDPLARLMLPLYAVFLVLYGMTGQQLFFLLALLCVLLLLLAQRLAPRLAVRGLTQQLTPHFYAVRTLSGHYSIFQRSIAPKERTDDCKALLQDLVREQVLLPTALQIAGDYQALTHAPILRRLRAMERVHEITAAPAYKDSLAPIYARMTHGRCKSCPTPCMAYIAANRPRPFFFVTFTIK